MAQENALIVLDDQRQEGMRFGRVRNRRELTTDWTGELPKVVEFATIVPLPTDVERICEVNHLRRRVQVAEARERKQRRRAQETEARCSMRLTNIAGVCIFGAMVLAALICLEAGAGWLAAVAALVAAGTFATAAGGGGKGAKRSGSGRNLQPPSARRTNSGHRNRNGKIAGWF